MKTPKFIRIEADVRYWDDATINGDSDESGSLVPFKDGSTWKPVIDIESGKVVDWPEGVTAEFHFKVCDAGSYHLLDENKEVIASSIDNYVPDGLCHGDEGFGDYIIFDVDGSGQILKYRNEIDISQFEAV